jgi:hypothetical protein
MGENRNTARALQSGHCTYVRKRRVTGVTMREERLPISVAQKLYGFPTCCKRSPVARVPSCYMAFPSVARVRSCYMAFTSVARVPSCYTRFPGEMWTSVR